MTEMTSSGTGWNPLAKRDPQTFPLECSGGAAKATFRPWSARERLAYEDRSLSLIGSDENGDATMRMGRVNALALSLTIASVDGFPATVEVERDGKIDVEPLDLRKLEHLELLDPNVYHELVTLSRKVQPLPGFDDRDEDEEPDAQTAKLVDPDEVDDPPTDEDPSLTPRTAPEAAASDDTPGELADA